MKIGILGLSYQVGNKGCEALSYAFLEVINKIAKKNNEIYEVYYITNYPTKRMIKNRFNTEKTMKQHSPTIKYNNIVFKYLFFFKKSNMIIIPNAKKLDVVFDFTFGDSFSDIYGKERFFSGTNLKKAFINKKVPLVLGSQTIGPFEDKEVKKMAIEVINNCQEVFVRDEQSYDYTKKISKRTPILTTDIAFELPYKKQHIDNKKFKIGFNASGLLWSGGYTGNNQFGLKVDYKNYCIETIKELLKNKNNEIYIISHATSKIKDYPDNDFIAAEEIKKMIPEVHIVDIFESAMEAKSFISSMDIFIGARMHATIASLSSEVPVIAFSYSRKFEGLFQSLNYPFIIGAKELNTESAVKQTIEWVENVEEIKKYIQESKKIIDQKNSYLEKKTEEVLNIVKGE